MKMNAQLSALCRDITDRNGFEIYRRLNAEFDPIAKGTEYLLSGQIMAMGTQCNNFEQSYKHLKAIKFRIDEYNKVTTGDPFEERINSWLATAVIDKDTSVQM